MSCIAIITARGGSKRIPRKNIKDFMGKPMLAYAIDAALNSGIFDEVMVSTEDKEIAEVAVKCGAQVPFMRSEKTANDFATTADVLNEVLSMYAEQGKKFDNMCCIYPCVPFLKSETLKDAYKLLKPHEAVMPVCKYPVPIEWAMKIENGKLIPFDKAAQQIRSQDLTPKYFDVGMFYFNSADCFYHPENHQTDMTVPYIISESECQDIDTPEDWKMAELKYKVMHNV